MTPTSQQPTTAPNNNVSAMQAYLKSTGYTPPAPTPTGNDWYSQIKQNAPAPTPSSPLNDLGNELQTNFENALNNTEKGISELQSGQASKPGSLAGADIELSGVGMAGADINSIIGAGAKAVSNAIPQPIKSALGSIVQKMIPFYGDAPQSMKDTINKAVTGLAQSIGSSYQDWATKNPEHASLVSNLMNTGSLATTIEAAPGAIEGAVKIVKATPDLVSGAIEKGGNIIQGGKDMVGGTISNITGLGKDAEELAIKNATPDVLNMSKADKEALLENQQLNPQKAFSRGTAELTPEEKDLAIRNKDLLQGKTQTENFYNVSNRVAEQDASIGQYLKDNPVSMDKEDLKQKIMAQVEKINKPLLATGKSWSKATSQAVNNFIDTIKGDNPITADGWSSRKIFDTQAENELSAFDGSPTQKKAVISAIRNTTQNYINDLTPGGVYKDTMREMSQLIDLKDSVLKPAAIKEIGSSGFKNWMRTNPGAAKIIRTLGGAARLESLLEISGR